MPVYDDKDYEDLEAAYAAQGMPFALTQQAAPEPDVSDQVKQAILAKQRLPAGMPTLRDLKQAQSEANDSRMWSEIGNAASGIGHAIAKVPRPQSDIQDWDNLRKGADQRAADIMQQREAGLKESAQDVQRERIRQMIMQRQSDQNQRQNMFQQGLESKKEMARLGREQKGELAAQHNELMAALKGTTETDKLNRQRDQNVATLSDRLSKNGLDELDSVITNIKANVDLNAKDDIPGTGQTGFLPDMLVTQKGKDVRQSISSLQNILLKARSGGAVTPQEAERYLNELGYGANKNDAQLRTGIKNTLNFLAAKQRNILAGYDDDVKRTYQSRGGKFADFTTGAPAPSNGGGWDDAKEKRYQELKAKQGQPQ